MQLIPISEDVLVNVEKISVVEIRKKKSGNAIAVVVDGRTFEVTVDAGLLLSELKRAGIDMTKQFFAV